MDRMDQELAFRQEMVDRLRLDLLGPVTGDEILFDRPTDRYFTGILFPQFSDVPPEEEEEIGEGAGDDDKESASANSAVPMAKASRPSAAGISFALECEGRPSINLGIRGARYRAAWSRMPKILKGKKKKQEVVAGPAELVDKEVKPGATRWKRVPFDIQLDGVQLSVGQNAPIPLGAHGVAGLELEIQVAKGSREGGFTGYTVTAVLVNCNETENSKRLNEENTFFQVHLSVTPGADDTVLVARPSHRSGSDKDLALIYREAKEFAVGHTCSADWKIDGAGDKGKRLAEVSTCWIPVTKVPSVSPEGDESCLELREKTLNSGWIASAGDTELVEELSCLPGAYRRWIDSIEKEGIPGLPSDLVGQGRKHLDQCRQVAKRMDESIDTIGKNEKAREAFQLANNAMNTQCRWAGRGQLTWRPFQLAYQLLVLDSLTRGDHPGREVMDLLWFPTGGGKTEAYLGLIAFTIFYRRLDKGEDGAGTAAFMRYTLRLLTIDQFQRAARLITACDLLRRDGLQGKLGKIPISIGLWVGASSTPNLIKDAVKQIAKDQNPTPRQVTHCPACGEKLDWRIRAERVVVTCREGKCPIGGSQDNRLPILTVDEDIYRFPPSLLIGTVDKFAQVTFQPGKTVNLFGGMGRFLPPDLVLQDELHLITGPLGSISGLYEMAIDELCTLRDGQGELVQRPKIIGSTATIKRADEQIRKLFNRETCQFPPPVIDAENSFFARPATDAEKPGRLYAAVSTAGRSPRSTLQGLYGSLLHSAKMIQADPDELRDPWWTLLGYFNSLRELGGSLILLYDDVPDSMGVFAKARLEHVEEDGYQFSERKINELEELTSRKSQVELRDILKDIKEHQYPGEEAFDAVLATNMVSVGVDVDRLGLMVIFSQPKYNAEYIQASSRVGRTPPGLILTVYKDNGARDRSRYETFQTWHQAMYRDVEPSTVTPLASRARDKALHAAIVAISAVKVAELRDSPCLDAGLRAQVESLVVSRILERAANVDPSELEGTERDARSFLDYWEERTREWERRGVTDPGYRHKDPARALLIGAEEAVTRIVSQAVTGNAKATLNSMRNVEPGSPYKLLEVLKPLVGDSDG